MKKIILLLLLLLGGKFYCSDSGSFVAGNLRRSSSFAVESGISGVVTLAIPEISLSNHEQDKFFDSFFYRHNQFIFGRRGNRLYFNFFDGKRWTAYIDSDADFALEANRIYHIGVKDIDIPADSAARMKKKIAMGILVEMLFGSTSDFAIDVYESGLVNGFAASFVHDSKRSMILLEGEADEPEAVYEKLLFYLAEKQKNGLSEADFSRVKRALYASFIKMYDSTRLAGDFTHMIHDDMEPFSYGDAVRDVTLQDVQVLFPQLFREEAYAMSVVDPISQND